MSRQLITLLALCSACVGGQTGVPTSDDHDGGLDCEPTLDTGVSPDDLSAAFEGEYTLTATGLRDPDVQRIKLGPTAFSISVTRTDAFDAGPYCGAVAARVRVVMRSPLTPEYDFFGTLIGTPQRGLLSFPAPGTAASLPSGGLTFEPGKPPQFFLYSDELTQWLSVDPEQP